VLLDFTVHQRLGVRVFNQTRNVRVYLRPPPPPTPILSRIAKSHLPYIWIWVSSSIGGGGGVESPSCCKKSLNPFSSLYPTFYPTGANAEDQRC
jgi:hypothetical protein